MARNATPVTVTEMPIETGAHADRIVARFADWQDAADCARRWSEGTNRDTSFYQVRFNDGYTVATENFLKGLGGDYVSRPTRAGRIMRERFEAGNLP